MKFISKVLIIILLSLCCALVCALSFGETYGAENLAFDKYIVAGSNGITPNYVISNQSCYVDESNVDNFKFLKSVPPNAHPLINSWGQLNPIYWLNEFNLWLGGYLPNNVTLPDLPDLPDLHNDTSLNPTFWNGVGDYNPVVDYKEKKKEEVIHYDIIEGGEVTHKVVNLSKTVKTVNKTVNNSTITKLDYDTCFGYNNIVSGRDGATNTLFIYNTDNTNEYELILEEGNKTMITDILD